jgi:hypothetical protein
LQQSFVEEGRAPVEALEHFNRTEPTSEHPRGFGSSVPSFSVDKYLSEKARRLITRSKTRNDSEKAGKEKARERSELELGASVASIGGRAQWVKRSERASELKRDCCAVGGGSL